MNVLHEVDKEVKKLAGKKVKKIQDKYHLEGYGYIATYGNYFQLVQVR